MYGPWRQVKRFSGPDERNGCRNVFGLFVDKVCVRALMNFARPRLHEFQGLEDRLVYRVLESAGMSVRSSRSVRRLHLGREFISPFPDFYRVIDNLAGSRRGAVSGRHPVFSVPGQQGKDDPCVLVRQCYRSLVGAPFGREPPDPLSQGIRSSPGEPEHLRAPWMRSVQRLRPPVSRSVPGGSCLRLSSARARVPARGTDVLCFRRKKCPEESGPRQRM